MPGDEFDERFSGVPLPPIDWQGWKERKYKGPPVKVRSYTLLPHLPGTLVVTQVKSSPMIPPIIVVLPMTLASNALPSIRYKAGATASTIPGS